LKRGLFLSLSLLLLLEYSCIVVRVPLFQDSGTKKGYFRAKNRLAGGGKRGFKAKNAFSLAFAFLEVDQKTITLQCDCGDKKLA
jgi:hypothetical protein